MKTKEELNALKEEVETLNRKLHELTDEELEQVTGGDMPPPQVIDPSDKQHIKIQELKGDSMQNAELF